MKKTIIIPLDATHPWPEHYVWRAPVLVGELGASTMRAHAAWLREGRAPLPVAVCPVWLLENRKVH